MNGTENNHIVPGRILILVWAGLMVLMAATLLVSAINLGALNIWLAVCIACFKSGLVLSYFMHLKFETRLLRSMVFISLGFFLVLISFIFLDVNYR